jgi:hypothetical protein
MTGTSIVGWHSNEIGAGFSLLPCGEWSMCCGKK